MKNKKFSIILFALCMLFSFTLMDSAASMKNVDAASASSINKKAVKAYKKMLTNAQTKWSDYSTVATSSLEFICIDVDKDGIKELFVYNPNAAYAEGYYKIYTYKNSKVKCLGTFNEELTIYKNSGIVKFTGAHTGSYWINYRKISKGKLIEKAFIAGTDNKENIPESVTDIHEIKILNTLVYACDYRVDGTESTYKQYKAVVKQLTNGNSKVKALWRTNTSKNITKYIK